MIIKIKNKDECLEAGFRSVISLYGLDVANNLLKNKEDELLCHLPDDIFDNIKKHIAILRELTGRESETN